VFGSIRRSWFLVVAPTISLWLLRLMILFFNNNNRTRTSIVGLTLTRLWIAVWPRAVTTGSVSMDLLRFSTFIPVVKLDSFRISILGLDGWKVRLVNTILRPRDLWLVTFTKEAASIAVLALQSISTARDSSQMSFQHTFWLSFIALLLTPAACSATSLRPVRKLLHLLVLQRGWAQSW
jgi:hypothetical protein